MSTEQEQHSDRTRAGLENLNFKSLDSTARPTIDQLLQAAKPTIEELQATRPTIDQLLQATRPTIEKLQAPDLQLTNCCKPPDLQLRNCDHQTYN